MSMSFGVMPSALGDGGDPSSSSSSTTITTNVSSTPLPPVPGPFSLPSAGFTFPGSSSNPIPSRLPLAPSAGFSFGPRFSFPITPPAAVPPSASSGNPFHVQPGFNFQGPSGNHLSSGTAVAMRPLPPTAMQGPVSGAQSVHGAGPPPLQGSGILTSTDAPRVAPTAGGFPLPIPLGTQTRPAVPLTTVVPPVPPGQMQGTAISPPIGGLPAARPGMVLPNTSPLNFTPPRPAYATNPGAPTSIVPPGGMAPRFPAPPFAPMIRPPTLPLRAVGPLVRPPGTMLRPGTLLPRFPMVPAGADLSKAAGPFLLLEKPQTLVYVGKIASTVDDDFLRSLLELCGPIKSWKRAQEPTTGTPKGFGFCEFELPEGVLRALRLLNGFSLEGQELKITVNTSTREYLERFVQKKKEREEQLKVEASHVEMEVETAPGVEAPEPVKKPVVEAPPTTEPTTESRESNAKTFGIVNEEDQEKDDEAQKKLESLLEERAKTMPLPPPPPLPSASDAPCKSNSVPDTPAISRDGDSIADGGKNGAQEGINEEEHSENKVSSEFERLDTGSSDQGRRLDHHRDRDRERERMRDREMDRARERGSRDRERERERERLQKNDREYEQAERERERNRARREREREQRMRDAERRFEEREREWEKDEKEKERRRNVDKEKEKEREKHRKRLIQDQEEGIDDEVRKKAKRRAEYDERKRRQREREDDDIDRLKEEQEIEEAKEQKLKEEYEEQVKKKMAEIEASKASSKAVHSTEGNTVDTEMTEAIAAEHEDQNHRQVTDGGDHEILKRETCDMDIGVLSAPATMEIDDKRASSPPLKKLGFGLIGSGKRTVVPSVFSQEDEEEAPNDRSFRELVPIDYTAEEMQVVSSLKMNTSVGATGPNLAGAAEFAKSLLNLGNNSAKEEMESEHDRARRQTDKSKSKDKERGSRDEMDRLRDRDKDKHKQGEVNREKENLSTKLDTKQLIDMIPKKKEELFAYKIDWKIYDQHELHERMKPWIQKKILEFLGEEEPTLVDYIVSNTRKHTSAAEMLDLLTTILDDEAELFVMKLWRMLIFEVKKIETGLAKPKG